MDLHLSLRLVRQYVVSKQGLQSPDGPTFVMGVGMGTDAMHYAYCAMIWCVMCGRQKLFQQQVSCII